MRKEEEKVQEEREMNKGKFYNIYINGGWYAAVMMVI
jgi:hypothetical protein